MTQTHTPGPLATHDCQTGKHSIYAHGPLCYVEKEANARLLAAAYTSYDKHFGPRAIECAEADLLGKALSLITQIATMTTYGDGPDQLADNEDAALCLNALIQQASAIHATATGLHFSDMKAPINPLPDQPMQDKAVLATCATPDVETAACLWEEVCTNRDNPLWASHFEANGTRDLRLQVIALAPECDRLWEVMSEDERDEIGAFDWEWCPHFLRDIVKWDNGSPHVPKA